MEKNKQVILKIISEATGPIGSTDIAKKLKSYGIDLSERSVRHYMNIMGKAGLTKAFWKEGRVITPKGLEEVGNSMVQDKVGLMISRIETAAYEMDFDLKTKQGRIILNISFLPAERWSKAIRAMKPVFDKKLSMGKMVVVAKEGERIGEVTVPQGKVGFGTLCSINLNGILLKHAVPIESKFGGLLQYEKAQPLRFTDLISYSGSTLDPHEIFIKSKMTNVTEATNRKGKILAGFRELPAISRDKAEEILERIEKIGLGNVIALGKPVETILGVPVGWERVGLVVPGGLNPVAAVEESGIETESKALTTMVDFKELKSFWDI